MTNLLKSFGDVSYYKVNFSKSVILGFSVPTSAKSDVQGKFPYTWNADSIPYLGVHLTNRLSYLLNANFPPLLKTVQADLDRIARVGLPWLGRVTIYKMIVLPKILYILRTLIISIPARIFHQFQVQMSKFIWQNKKPRLSLLLMRKKLHHGGMGLPDLKAYHIAVTLHQILVAWFD